MDNMIHFHNKWSLAVVTGTLLSVFALVSCHEKTGTSSKNEESVFQQEKGISKIEFNEMEHNFGTLTEGEVVSYTFEFKNTGTASLVIKSASASCGCTVPKYDKEPIPPGDSGSLEVVFNSRGKLGQQHKTVGIRTNGQPGFILLNIYAEVLKKSE